MTTMPMPTLTRPPLARMPRISYQQVNRLGGILAFLLGCYRQEGPIFRFRMPGSSEVVTVMAGLEANLFMNRQGGNHLSASAFRLEQNRAYGAGKTLVSLDGVEHQELRRRQQFGYSRQILERQVGRAIALTADAAERFRTDEPLPAHDFLTKLVAEQIGSLFLDYSPGEHTDDLAYFLRTVVQTTLMRTEPMSQLESERFLAARQRSWELADAMLASRRDITPADRNLLDDLLATQAEAPELLAPADLRIAALGPYIAGLDAIANSCSFILYALLAHPAILAQVQREVDALFAAGPVAAQGLRGLKTLQKVVMESLRLYPIAPALQGTVTAPFTFAGYEIPAGEPIIVAAAVTHFLPELYPDPETFDIERYSPGRQEHRQPGAFAAYGLGPHSCLGGSLADAQMMLTLATLLHHFDFAMEPAGYQLRVIANPLPCPSREFAVRMTPRQPTQSTV